MNIRERVFTNMKAGQESMSGEETHKHESGVRMNIRRVNLLGKPNVRA